MHAEPDIESHSACPRCGGAFHCGVNDGVPCACGTVALDEATLQALRECFSTCLCLNCLRQVQAEGGAG